MRVARLLGALVVALPLLVFAGLFFSLGIGWGIGEINGETPPSGVGRALAVAWWTGLGALMAVGSWVVFRAVRRDR